MNTPSECDAIATPEVMRELLYDAEPDPKVWAGITVKGKTVSRQKEFYQKLKLNGICVCCGYAKAAPKLVHCQSCHELKRKKVNQWHAQLMKEMKEAYGAICTSCGRADHLQFHHINGDGDEHRQSITGDSQGGHDEIFHDLRKRGFPPIMEPLCFWCHKQRHAQVLQLSAPNFQHIA
jgi:hypothetical protein